MKGIKTTLSLIYVLLISACMYAQAPQGIKYQSVIRNDQGHPITNQSIRLRLSILDNSDVGQILFEETHEVETNDFGLVNLTIGQGAGSWDFTDIPWDNGNEKWLKIEIDSTGGYNYTDMGASQLFSVPYALYAENGGGSGSSVWSAGDNGIFYNAGNVGIGTDTPDDKAALEIQSTTKGFLPPRMTESQRDAIDSPPGGLLIFNTTSQCINLFKSGTWYEICGTCMPPPQPDVSSNSPACEDGDIELYGSNLGGAEPHWSGPNGFTSTEQNPVIPNADDIHTGYYTLYTTNACGNSDPDSVLVELMPLPGDAGPFTGPNTVCEGDEDVAYSIDEVENTEWYEWNLPPGAVISSGDNTHSVLVDFPAGSESGNISVTPHNDCGSGGTNTPMNITVNPLPTTADAGPNQLNIAGSSTSLEGNTPAEGTGTWSIVAGTGGTVDEPSNPNSNFSGTEGNAYTLEWEISNGCGSSADSVDISFQAPFSCGDDLTDPRDGQTYATVEIGGQCWMAENLNIGDEISSSTNQTDNGTIEKYCYDNDSNNCNTCGGLYQWSEMMQLPDSCETAECASTVSSNHQGICPPGWHVPTDEEYKELEMELGMTQAQADALNTWRGAPVGDMMKEGGSSGFEALLCGRCSNTGGFSLMDSYEYPYTADEYGSNYAYRRCLRSGDDKVGRWNTFQKTYAFSVRCVKD
ncbi:MAG: FISUMP domain-containing protein [Bacteroidota bacterium]